MKIGRRVCLVSLERSEIPTFDSNSAELDLMQLLEERPYGHTFFSSTIPILEHGACKTPRRRRKRPVAIVYRSGREIKVLKYDQVLHALRDVAERSGRNPKYFALHSLRIGGPSTLAAGGNVSESE